MALPWSRSGGAFTNTVEFQGLLALYYSGAFIGVKNARYRCQNNLNDKNLVRRLRRGSLIQFLNPNRYQNSERYCTSKVEHFAWPRYVATLG
jgi:hypothetical protein